MIAYFGTGAQLMYAVFVDPVVRAYRKVRGIPEAPLAPGCRNCGHRLTEHPVASICQAFQVDKHDPDAVGRYEYERHIYERQMAKLGRKPLP